MPTLTAQPPDAEPAGLSTFATIGLLILAIGGLAAVAAWLYAWYQAREDAGVDPDDPTDPEALPADEPPIDEPPTDDPTAPTQTGV